MQTWVYLQTARGNLPDGLITLFAFSLPHLLSQQSIILNDVELNRAIPFIYHGIKDSGVQFFFG